EPVRVDESRRIVFRLFEDCVQEGAVHGCSPPNSCQPGGTLLPILPRLVQATSRYPIIPLVPITRGEKVIDRQRPVTYTPGLVNFLFPPGPPNEVHRPCQTSY